MRVLAADVRLRAGDEAGSRFDAPSRTATTTLTFTGHGRSPGAIGVERRADRGVALLGGSAAAAAASRPAPAAAAAGRACGYVVPTLLPRPGERLRSQLACDPSRDRPTRSARARPRSASRPPRRPPRRWPARSRRSRRTGPPRGRPRSGRARARPPAAPASSASRARVRRRCSRRRAPRPHRPARGVGREADEAVRADERARLRTAMSSWPTCTPSAPARATRSGRSLRMNSAPCVRADLARIGPRPPRACSSGASFIRSWTMSTPPRSAASQERVGLLVADEIQARA